MKLTPQLAEAVVRTLVFSGGTEKILITGSIAIGATKDIAPADIDFVCYRADFERILHSWDESPYFVSQGYKKVIDSITFNAIVATTEGEFQSWEIATKALYNPDKEWASKRHRISAFSPILEAAKGVLCS